MGICSSSASTSQPIINVNDKITKLVLKKKSKFFVNTETYSTMDKLVEAMRNHGVDSLQFIVGIDYTGSNRTAGQKSCQRKNLHINSPNLHDISSDGDPNCYQESIALVGNLIKLYDPNGKFPMYGFGDIRTRGTDIFSMKTNQSLMPSQDPSNPNAQYGQDMECNGLEDAIACYNALTPNIQMDGPTSFVPLIKRAIEYVKQTKVPYILVIIADGLMNDNGLTDNAIVEASNYDLSIIMIGVGDGPWHAMEQYDDKLKNRKFDNFQFVEFNEIIEYQQKHNHTLEQTRVFFARNALSEVPAQMEFMKARRERNAQKGALQ